MALLITVTPAEAGWTLQSDALEREVVFSSGAKAEAAARSLAQRIAEGGGAAELRIVVRDGSLGGAFLYPARASPVAMPVETAGLATPARPS
jgi:hypothetical protein